MKPEHREKKVELLAPAGGMAALRAVLSAGADAVYLSGKRFGMRGHRASAHFDDHALKIAIAEAHAAGARIYVTVNNLLADEELASARDYIGFLAGLGADAVIIQDLGLLRGLSLAPPPIEIHASTMMNVHSSPFAALLASYGVNRIITSRDVSLAEVAEMRRRTGLEMEYFVHGDMCSVQSGLCHASGVLFGLSANRGRCLKPCRWRWQLVSEKSRAARGKPRYLLARKDMCLLHALPAVIEAGIAALKIEGRMRPAEFLEEVVGVYRRAIDRYYEDPLLYREESEDAKSLFRSRARDFASCHAFGQPGPGSIGASGAREPHLFSAPVEAPVLEAEAVAPEPALAPLPPEPPAVSAAVADPEVFGAVLAEKPDWIYLVPHLFLGSARWTRERISAAVDRCQAAGVHAAIVLPPITPDRELDHLAAFAASIQPAPDAWMAGNAGQLRVVKGAGAAALMTDAFFNVFNADALAFLAGEGASRASLSPEVSADHLAAMPRPLPLEVEYPVHGDIQVMFTEDCLIRIALDRSFDPGSCRHFCDGPALALEDDAGDRFPIVTAAGCRNAVFAPRRLCLLHRLAAVSAAGARSLRLNLLRFAPGAAAAAVRIYREALARLFAGDPGWFRREDWRELEQGAPEGLWEGASRYGVVPARPAQSTGGAGIGAGGGPAVHDGAASKEKP